MDPVSALIGLAVGALLGAGVVWFLSQRRQASLRESTIRAEGERDALAAQVAELRRVRDELDAARSDLQAMLSTARADQARLETALENEKKNAGEKLSLLDEAQKKLRDAFQALSAEALRQSGESFLKLAKTHLGEYQQAAKTDLETRQKSIGEMLKPVRESLQKVDTRIENVERARAEAYGKLREQVMSMTAVQKALQTETSNLVRALRTPNVRGRWGEIQLRRVVEMAGMLNHCDFHEQPSTDTEGGRLRPDLIVRLPGGKHVVVDAKAPLQAYLEAVEAGDDETRAAALAHHARQVKDHMTRLGEKAYWNEFDPAPEFVVMFLPSEALFTAALEQMPELIEYGVDRKVIPASPTTLIALLRAVAYGWQQEQVAENAQEISRLGRDLYDRLRVLTGHFVDLGKRLDRTVETYNKAMSSLESRVLVQGRRFQELGAASAEELPPVERIDRTARTPRIEEDGGETGAPRDAEES